MAEFLMPYDMTAQLIAYGRRLQKEAVAAADKAAVFLHERVVAKATQDPQWTTMADQIEVWSADGQLIVGIRNDEFVSQAFAIEYGDEVRPPSPLFRSLSEDMREAGQVMTEHLTSAAGGFEE